MRKRSVGRPDRLIASVTDDDGCPISLPTGLTVNLLIDLNEGGGLVRLYGNHPMG